MRNQAIIERMPTQAKKWLIKLAQLENFDEISEDLKEHIDDLYDEWVYARMENGHCSKCGKTGCKVEIRDLAGNEIGMLCDKCFNINAI